MPYNFCQRFKKKNLNSTIYLSIFLNCSPSFSDIQALDHAAGQSAKRQRTEALKERWRRAAVELAEEAKAIIKGIITGGVTLSLVPGLDQSQGITGLFPRSLGTRIGKLRVMKKAEVQKGHTGQSPALDLGHKRPQMLICRGGQDPNPARIQNRTRDPAHGLGRKIKCCPFLPYIPLLKSITSFFFYSFYPKLIKIW